MLYNYARVASLINQVDRLVKENSYPALIPLQEVDFSLLKKEVCRKNMMLLLSYFITIKL